MTTNKNLKTIASATGVPILFTALLMSTFILSLPPFFLAMNERFTSGIGGVVLVLLIIYAFLKIEQKTWSDYYLKVDKQTLTRFALGSITGLLLATAMFLLQAGVIGLNISFEDADFGMFAWLSLTLIPLAFMEELAFRSYAFLKLKNAYGIWVAQIAIALLFGLYHYIGGWSLYVSFAGPFVWSFAFGLLAIKSNGIALPTGFHYGLNLALALIGNKEWIPSLVRIDFAETPTDAMLAANAYFGGAMQFFVFVALLIITYRYTSNTDGKRASN